MCLEAVTSFRRSLAVKLSFWFLMLTTTPSLVRIHLTHWTALVVVSDLSVNMVYPAYSYSLVPGYHISGIKHKVLGAKHLDAPSSMYNLAFTLKYQGCEKEALA